MKSVSVIVPVYNMESYLEKCMDSLVNQTLDDIEIIVVNDGSVDNSLKILNKYKKKYPEKVQVINQENSGISVARNNGLKKATGKYVGFVDSDDFIDLNMFKHLYDKCKKINADIVVCNYKKYYSDTDSYESVDVVRNIHCSSLFEEPSLINSIYYAPWNKLYKRSLFDGIKFPVNKKYEDINAILKVFLKAKKIGKLDEYLYLYRINNSGETLTINKKISDIVYILKDLVDWCKKLNEYHLIESEMEKLCVNSLFYYLILSYQINDKNYILDFRKNIIVFLNLEFKNWKSCFMNKSILEINKIQKIVLMNDLLFKIFINRKIKMTNE